MRPAIIARTVSRRSRLGIARTPRLILMVPTKLTEYDHVRPDMTSLLVVLAAIGADAKQ
jgi:hypothetical protein